MVLDTASVLSGPRAPAAARRPPTFRSSACTNTQRIAERELHLAPVLGGVEIERDDLIVAGHTRATNAAPPRCDQAKRSTNDVSMP